MNPTIEVRNLRTHFFTRAGVVKAVDDVSFSVGNGQVLGLVGESGSGKTVTGFSIIGLVDPPAGSLADRSGIRAGTWRNSPKTKCGHSVAIGLR